MSKYFDKRLFLDLDEKEMVRRRLDRSEGTSLWDSPEYIKNKLIPGRRRYVLGQKKYADLVLDASDSPQVLASRAHNFIRTA